MGQVFPFFFADDVLLFAKATVAQAKLIKRVLDFFSSISGLKVSLAKSAIFASKGVPTTKRVKIKSILDINFTSSVGRYLGFKIFQGRILKEDFLASWIVLTLSWHPGKVGF